MKSAVFNQILPWILPLILLAAWQGLSSTGILASRVLLSPIAVLIAGIHLTQTDELPLHLFESFRRAATGLMIGGVIRVSARTVERAFDGGGSAPAFFGADGAKHSGSEMIPLVILWF